MKNLMRLAALLLGLWAGLCPQAFCQALSTDDEAFLDLVQRKAFDFFWQEADPVTGLIPDGTHAGSGGSIASVGWGLSAICVADSRQWISHQEAYDRVLATLKSFADQNGKPDSARVEGHYGLFFHFVNIHSGRWFDHWDCVSTADTAMLMAGVITCMEYFHGTEIETLGDRIFRACQWYRFMRGDAIAMGYVPPDQTSAWTVEKGFFGRYSGYQDNSFMINLLGLASPTHPIPTAAWYAAQSTYHWTDYKGQRILATTPPGLAFHYYPHAWLDLRCQKDQAADYFENTRKAVLAQQDYCRQAGYPEGLWGLSSSQSDSDKGYEAFGAPLAGTLDRGILTPHAIAGGMVFTPEKSLETLKRIYAEDKNRVWGRYGFTDAFSVKNGWASRNFLGLDQGPIVVMIENYRTGLIWKNFSSNRYIRDALGKIGFRGVVEDFEQAGPVSDYSRYALVSGQAELTRSDDGSVKGRHCLVIRPQAPGPLTLDFQPRLTDFSRFNYLALWTRHAQEVRPMLRDRQGGSMELKSESRVGTGLWVRHDYPLTGLKKIDRSAVADVILRLTPDQAGCAEGIGLDEVGLTYRQVLRLPEPPSQVLATVPQANAMVKIVFQPAAGVYQYDCRFSDRPILNERDFEKLPTGDPCSAAAPTREQTVFLAMPGPGKYYIAVESLDPMGLRSPMVSAGPVTVARSEAGEILADFQTQDLDSSRAAWRGSSEGIHLAMAPASGASGQRSLRVQYQKAGTYDYLEMSFAAPLDVSPYRFLKMRVFGRERLIAKLFNAETRQEDIAEIQSQRPDAWNNLRFDMSAMPTGGIDKQHVQKILIFMEPGEVAAGEFYIGKVWLEGR